MDGQIQLKRSFLKRFWWLGLIIILAFFSFVLVKTLNNKQGNTIGEKIENINRQENFSLDNSLPACPSDTSTLFTKPFMDGDKPDSITPLGNSSYSGHVVPVDHVYPSNIDYAPDVPIYAPGRLTLIWVENKQMYNSVTNEKILPPDFQLNFAPCRGINLAFIHLTKLSDKLAAALTEKEDSKCGGDKVSYADRNGAKTYYLTCHPNFKQVTVEPGEMIGYFGFQDSNKPQVNFDIGLYDYNKPTVGFVNPARYYDDTNHTACFADYYVPELQAKYEAKLGIFEQDTDGKLKFVRRTAKPVCGQVMHDIPGTASGDWFKSKQSLHGVTDQDALVLIHDNIHSDKGRMSMAGVASFTFAPKHVGQIDRDFTEVTADDKIYCYEQVKVEGSKAGDIKSVTKYLVQLIDATHIKAEQQSGTCSTSESFISPDTFER